MMPTVPDYPEEDWMSQLGMENGSRQRFAQGTRTWRIPFMTPGQDYSRWNVMPKSEHVEDVRGQEPPVREVGETMAGWNKEERYMYQHHLDNLKKGGVKNVVNDTISTYAAISVERDGKYYMIPTVWDNKRISNDKAIKRAKSVGFDKFPSYFSRDQAEGRYQNIHKAMEEDVQKALPLSGH